MKKILAMMTALCCVSSMMAVLPASAEELTTKQQGFYMIASVQENQNSSAPDYVLYDMSFDYNEENPLESKEYTPFFLSGEEVENIRIVGADSLDELEYGMYLCIEGGAFTVDSSSHIHLTEKNYLYPEYVPEYHKLILAGMTDYDGYTEFTLKDNYQKEYTFKQWDDLAFALNLNDCQTGDCIAFITDDWNTALLPVKQLDAPETPNLEEKKDGFYAVVLNANYHSNSNGLYVMPLEEEHLGKAFFINLPEPRSNPYPLSENDYQADVYLDNGDLIYMHFSGEYEMLGNGKQGYMHFTKEDSIQWCGNAFDYLETTPYEMTGYLKEKRVFEYKNQKTGAILEDEEYYDSANSRYAQLHDSVLYLTYHDVPLFTTGMIENPKKAEFADLVQPEPLYLVLDDGITVQKIGHKIPDTPEWQEYKEYWQVPDYKFKQQSSETLQMNDGLNGQLDGQERPKTGDLLHINFTGSIAEIYPGCMHFNKEDTIENLGNITEIATLKDLTVADAETNTVTLKDADGEIYYYQKGDLSFYDEFGSAYTAFDPKAGETITFYMYENEPILPKLNDITVNPVPTVTATGDADGSGELDILDIITVNKAILGKEALSEDKISSVDFNGNGIPDADDALTMLKMLVGLI